MNQVVWNDFQGLILIRVNFKELAHLPLIEAKQIPLIKLCEMSFVLLEGLREIAYLW